jgi:DMSO reductase iron-sulfur subunit
MFKVRADEPKYAFLWDKETKAQNRYGLDIETAPQDSPFRLQDFIINDEVQQQKNPNRYKQHGFYFNADNCIFCHACEAACSEKNDNPAHIAFRSVGFVESGTYPNYNRLSMSMACNHCDDPVCLKGCPTRAYTKFTEYGAVLQDPDTCFGCGYCTWVCPYNAPQLDPVKGEVSKCNMCVDRLEVGLKPACVSACLGNALDFGVIENTPKNRTQSDITIPGFPRTDITHPNIRFEQKRDLQNEVTRIDSMPVKYHKDNEGNYQSILDEKHGRKRTWGLGRLLTSHENAHVMFTLSAQTVMGAFLVLVLGGLFNFASIDLAKQSSAFIPLLVAMVTLMGLGLFKLNMHLGKPHRFYRGFNNLRLSPVSREIVGVSAFFTGLMGYSFFSLFDYALTNMLAGLFALLGLAGLATGSYYMYKLYRIPARPFWDHWQTATAFYGTMLALGSVLITAMILVFADSTVHQTLLQTLSLLALIGLSIEAIGLFIHARDLKQGEGEAAAAHYEQTTTYGNSYWLRNALLGLNILALFTLSLTGITGTLGIVFASLLALSLLVMSYLERIIFYALVIPTTMPGAFFWRNKGFVEHARETGLADREQVGVVYEGHHKFDLKELLQTIKENSPKDMFHHVKWIFTGK